MCSWGNKVGDHGEGERVDVQKTPVEKVALGRSLLMLSERF